MATIAEHWLLLDISEPDVSPYAGSVIMAYDNKEEAISIKERLMEESVKRSLLGFEVCVVPFVLQFPKYN